MSRNHFNELSPCEALIMKLIWEAWKASWMRASSARAAATSTI